MTEHVLRALAGAAWRAVEERHVLQDGRTLTMPELPPDLEVNRSAHRNTDLLALRHLDDAIEATQGLALAGLARRLASSAQAVLWTQNPSYTPDTVGQDFIDNYAYALLSGPEGPLVCDAPYSGFLLLGPGVHYPDHRHAPREIYLIMTPGARWSLDSGEWFDVAPGDLIYHAPWQPHATRVAEQPFLAFVAWLDSAERKSIEI